MCPFAFTINPPHLSFFPINPTSSSHLTTVVHLRFSPPLRVAVFPRTHAVGLPASHHRVAVSRDPASTYAAVACDSRHRSRSLTIAHPRFRHRQCSGRHEMRPRTARLRPRQRRDVASFLRLCRRRRLPFNSSCHSAAPMAVSWMSKEVE
ncbi:hypothetical protein ACSQ67_010041 [Phaseolus vulgaris]